MGGSRSKEWDKEGVTGEGRARLMRPPPLSVASIPPFAGDGVVSPAIGSMTRDKIPDALCAVPGFGSQLGCRVAEFPFIP